MFKSDLLIVSWLTSRFNLIFMIFFCWFITDPASCGGPVSIYPGAPGFSEVGRGPRQREDSSQGGWRGCQTGRRVGAEQSRRDCRVRARRARDSQAKLEAVRTVPRELNFCDFSHSHTASPDSRRLYYWKRSGAAVLQHTTSATWACNGRVPKAVVLVKAYTLLY